MDTLSAGLAGRVIFVWKLVGLLLAGACRRIISEERWWGITLILLTLLFIKYILYLRKK